MSFLPIPRAEHDFMYVSVSSGILLTFWLIKDDGAISTFAYIIGDGKELRKCSRMSIKSDDSVSWSHDDESEDDYDWIKVDKDRLDKYEEVTEFIEAYKIWKVEIESILIGELCD